MKLRILGTAAGGGFPQWNCGCRVCASGRQDPDLVASRLQSGVAISSQKDSWWLVNASPDIPAQIEKFLRPAAGMSAERRSPLNGIFLTNADFDHVLGLFLLREGGPMRLWAPDGVRASISRVLGLDRLLGPYCGIDWMDAPVDQWFAVDGGGLEAMMFPLSGAAPPRYEVNGDPEMIHGCGWLFRDRVSRRTAGIFPDVAMISERLIGAMRQCEVIFFDGTFFTETEMSDAGLGTRSARDMGHLPISGPSGSLNLLASLPARTCQYLHINNSNPILLPDSAERRTVLEAGVGIASDGLEIEL